MDYALLFTVMGLAIAYLLYVNYRLTKSVVFHRRVVQGFVSGELEVNQTEQGFEITMKKEV